MTSANSFNRLCDAADSPLPVLQPSQCGKVAAHLTGCLATLKVSALLMQDLGVHVKGSCKTTAVQFWQHKMEHVPEQSAPSGKVDPLFGGVFLTTG